MWHRKKGDYFAGDSEITSSYEHVSHSELSPKYNYLNTQTQLRYIFVCGVGWVAKCARVRWVHETNCSFEFSCYCQHKERWRPTPTTLDFRTEVAGCIVYGVGIFEHLLWGATNLSFLRNKSFRWNKITVKSKINFSVKQYFFLSFLQLAFFYW